MKKNIIVLGHRGYRAKFPENTILSAKKAIEYGADGIEFDIQKTKDRFFVVIHDDSINRTAINNKKGYIKDKSLRALRNIDLGKNQKISELSEFLKTLDQSTFINIELKEETIRLRDCPEIYKILINNIKSDKIIVSSFNHDLLPYFSKSGLKIGMLIGTEHKHLGAIGIFKRILKIHPDYMNLNIKIFSYLGTIATRIVLALIRFMGCKIVFWTVNSKEELKNAINYGDIIITDEVEFVTNWIKTN